ncbi:methyltransferase domain-containing protein [Thermopolyspora sp. NPDC052614]|uniref:class I SAM-dependent methyltransferase n=1 Tax=Thermopolyspora sp. NPDC052614 TaxID=3155682 RepID=UPI00343715B2
MSDTRTFLAAILRRPKELGAIAPSSKALAKRAAVPVPTTGSPLVVELGPGGGVITDQIRSRLPVDGRLLAVEYSGEMVRHLRETRPWLEIIHGDAMRLGDLMRAEGVRQADVIVSTLPWTLFDDAAQARLLRQITALLAPGGTFCTVLTLTAWPFPNARRFRRRLASAFGEVATTRPVWGNVPPALLYVCARPRHHGGNGGEVVGTAPAASVEVDAGAAGPGPAGTIAGDRPGGHG